MLNKLSQNFRFALSVFLVVVVFAGIILLYTTITNNNSKQPSNSIYSFPNTFLKKGDITSSQIILSENTTVKPTNKVYSFEAQDPKKIRDLLINYYHIENSPSLINYGANGVSINETNEVIILDFDSSATTLPANFSTLNESTNKIEEYLKSIGAPTKDLSYSEYFQKSLELELVLSDQTSANRRNVRVRYKVDNTEVLNSNGNDVALFELDKANNILRITFFDKNLFELKTTNSWDVNYPDFTNLNNKEFVANNIRKDDIFLSAATRTYEFDSPANIFVMNGYYLIPFAYFEEINFKTYGIIPLLPANQIVFK